MDTLRKELKDAAEQYLFRLNEGRIFGAQFMRGDIKAAFEAGYHEAEKDLTLTWEDMHLAFKVINTAIDNCEGKTRQEVFQEAARLFNEQRQKK